MSMSLLMICIIIAYLALKSGAAKKKSDNGGPPAPRKAPKPLSALSAARVGAGPAPNRMARRSREQMQERAKWSEARKQQDDAEHLHSVHVDSCEGRLQSLKVLYEAGILEREEYLQRVARTKARHAHGRAK